MKLNLRQEKILHEIRQAKIKEEIAIPLYTSHIKEVLFWSGLSEEKKKEIIKDLKILERESEIHIAMLKRVEKIFLRTKNNVK